MRTSARGNRAELKVAAELQRLGYLVASRRHLGGAGDLLAHYWPRHREVNGEPMLPFAMRPLLVEVKATTTVPWASSNFGRPDREAMIETGYMHDVMPILAWVPPYLAGIVWLPVEDWP